jgi:hypothetical protein
MIHFSSPRSVRRQHVGGPASLVRSKGSYMSPEHSMPCRRIVFMTCPLSFTSGRGCHLPKDPRKLMKSLMRTDG